MKKIKNVVGETTTHKKITHKKYSTNLFGLSRKQWSNIIDRTETVITDVLVVTTFGILPFVGLFLAWFGRCL